MVPTHWVRVREIAKWGAVLFIWEYKWCCPITLRATRFVCIREVTLSFSEQLSKLEGPSCSHLLPSQTLLANQEIFLVLTSEEKPQALLSTSFCRKWSPLSICAINQLKNNEASQAQAFTYNDALALSSFPVLFYLDLYKGIRCVF